MRYLKYTHVDSVTGVPVTVSPSANGPAEPSVAGLKFVFALESQYPTDAPTLYGTAPDASDIAIAGVLGELTAAEFDSAQAAEMATRKVLADEQLVAAIASRRYRAEISGFIWDGFFIATDRESQAKIQSHRSAAKDGIRQDGAVWKCSDPQTGLPVFRPTSNVEMIEIGDAAFNFVQATYTREGELMAGIADGTTTQAMVDEGWPESSFAQ